MSALPVALVDGEPQNEAERLLKFAFLSEQVRAVGLAVGEAKVTCPCGSAVNVLLVYHCFFCGLYLCRACAARHFGQAAVA